MIDIRKMTKIKNKIIKDMVKDGSIFADSFKQLLDPIIQEYDKEKRELEK